MRISDWSSDVCSSDLTEITRAKACRHRAKYARNIPDGLCRVEPPIFCASIEREFFGGLARDHVDDAANGPTDPKYGLRTSHDFDSLVLAGDRKSVLEGKRV